MPRMRFPERIWDRFASLRLCVNTSSIMLSTDCFHAKPQSRKDERLSGQREIQFSPPHLPNPPSCYRSKFAINYLLTNQISPRSQVPCPIWRLGLWDSGTWDQRLRKGVLAEDESIRN